MFLFQFSLIFKGKVLFIYAKKKCGFIEQTNMRLFNLLVYSYSNFPKNNYDFI